LHRWQWEFDKWTSTMMKNLTLINNFWKQLVKAQLSSEEKSLLYEHDESKQNQIDALMQRIINESLVSADAEDAISAQAIYDQHKIAGAEFISANLSLPDENGIINCRVNGQHKQIRF